MSGPFGADVRRGPAPASPDAPTLSLVVVSSGGREALRALLVSVLPVAEAHGVEVVVARGGSRAEAAELAAEFPRVRFVAAPEDAGPGALRFTGMAEAGGDVVMLALDDDPSAPERLVHLCRTCAPAGHAAEAADPRVPSPPAAPERRGPVERAGRPAWAAAV